MAVSIGFLNLFKSITSLTHYMYILNDFSQKECTQPTNILQTECSNKQNCSVSFPETEMTRCESKYADFLDFEYQCIPTLPPKNSVPYTICTDKAVMQAPNGIIQSPGYPTYVAQVVSCSITLTPPVNTGVKFFFIDLSLSTANLSQDRLEKKISYFQLIKSLNQNLKN